MFLCFWPYIRASRKFYTYLDFFVQVHWDYFPVRPGTMEVKAQMSCLVALVLMLAPLGVQGRR